MSWKDKCLQTILDNELFLSRAQMNRFVEEWQILKDQPFCTKGMCKCLFLSSWDQEHYLFLVNTVNEMRQMHAQDTSYMLEKGKRVVDSLSLSERELFQLSIDFLSEEGKTPDERVLVKLSHHWVPITDNVLELGRILDEM